MSDGFAVLIDKPIVRQHPDPEHARSSLFPVGVHLNGDKVFVEIGYHGRVPEGLILHRFAGTTPGGIKMEKDFFILGFAARHAV